MLVKLGILTLFKLYLSIGSVGITYDKVSVEFGLSSFKNQPKLRWDQSLRFKPGLTLKLGS